MDEKPTALLVEDDVFIAGLALEHFKDVFETTHVEGVHAARQALAERSFDVLFLDIMLPDGDGIDFLAGYRASNPEHPALAVMLTNLGDEVVMKRATDAGAELFFVKSTANYREIAQTVLAELEQRAGAGQ
ncbi:response regulator [Patescibacteria group bacterium]|jgi:DNA-binding response OmpR family regulator|nr:response regulator [Patescibacteria group bacterium]